MHAIVALAVLTLHTLDGRVIHINPSEIVSVGQVSKDQLTSGARCVITLTNGKFISVSEECDSIMQRLNEK